MNIRKKILICPNTKLQKVIVNSSMEIKFNLMTYHVTSNSRRPTGEQAHQIFQFNSHKLQVKFHHSTVTMKPFIALASTFFRVGSPSIVGVSSS